MRPLALLLFLLCPLAALGWNVDLAPEHRLPNRSGSQCVWVSLESLCRHHGIAQGYGLSRHRLHATGPGEAHSVLRQLGVPFRYTLQRDTAFLREWVSEKKAGVAYAIPGHMLLLVHWSEGDGKAAIIDNAGPRATQVQQTSTERFLSRWSGWTIAIVPPGPEDGWRPIPLPPAPPGFELPLPSIGGR